MASTRMAMANGRLHRAFLEKSGIRFGALEREHERLRCSHPVAHCRASALSLVPVPGRRDAGQAIAATGSVFRTIARQDSVLYSGRRWTDVFRRRAQYIFGASGVLGATWRSGYATVCKTVYPGSIPGVASKTSHPGIRENATSRSSCGGLLSCRCARFRGGRKPVGPNRPNPAPPLAQSRQSRAQASASSLLLCSNVLLSCSKHK